MSFSISFLEEPLSHPYDDKTTPAARGILMLGAAREYFLASLYHWSKKDYEKQWHHAIKTLLDGRNKAALITTYGSPEVATHLEWWPMYVRDCTVFIQDHLLFYDQLAEPFSVQNAFSFLRDRQTTNEHGKKISEWKVELFEVEAFARTLSS